MFYKDEKGINTVQLGTGDVLICGLRYKDTPENELSGIGFGEIEPGDINRYLPNMEGKTDFESNVKLKLLFTDKASIDVLINALSVIKKTMEDE